MLGLLADVTAFHKACGQPVLDRPAVPSRERIELRARLILEEAQEVDEAFAWVVVAQHNDHPPNLAPLAKELADLIYVCAGTALEFGIPLDRVWQEVQRSNMAKAGPNGEVVFDANGKVTKPEGWTPPDIRGAICGDNNAD